MPGAVNSILFLRCEVRVWGLGRQQSACLAVHHIPDLFLVSRRFPASQQLAAQSSFPASVWKAGPRRRVCSWLPAPGPHGHIILRLGSVSSRAVVATEPSLCGQPSLSVLGASCIQPPPGVGGTRAGGDPERSLGPAGRRRRAGCGGDANLFRGNENGDCWPRIHCTGPPSDRWSPAPTRTGCSFIATVKGGSCQSSARAHAHTRGGEKVFF